MRRRPNSPPLRSSNDLRPPSRSAAGGLFWLALTLLVCLLAIAIAGRFLLERRLAVGPTPTITRQPASAVTPTADFRATSNIQDLITQAAYKVAQVGINTPTRDVTDTPTATATATETPEAFLPTSVPVPQTVVFVPVIGGSSGATPTSQPTDTPTPGDFFLTTPTPLPGEATQTAEAGATATALQFTPTATDTPLPTVTPTSLPPGAPPVVPLQAVTKDTVIVYAGPGVRYRYVNTLPKDLTVRLEGRSASGEWVRLCCVNNVDGWARQVLFRITGNPTPVGSPSGTTGDDVARLSIQQPRTTPLTPMPTATAIADADFPLFRRDSAATGRVETQFRPPITYGWSEFSLATAGAGFSAPPVVVGSSVIAASLDQELYSFGRDIGNQLWRVRLGSVIEYTPAVQDPYIYVVNSTGEIISVRGTGSSSDAIAWRKRLDSGPSAALNVRDDTLFAVGLNHVLYALHRLDNGRELWRYSLTPGPRLQYPAIGDQMIYVGDARLSALDIYSPTLIWEDSQVKGVAGPPVYVSPGVKALAEVYAVDYEGRIHALDANTGAELWRRGNSDVPTSLAVDGTRVYAAGPGFVAARDRNTGGELWRTAVADIGVPGGPIVGNGRLLAVGISGSLQVLDAANGTIIHSTSIAASLVGAPAVSEGWIFLASHNGRLYGMKENN